MSHSSVLDDLPTPRGISRDEFEERIRRVQKDLIASGKLEAPSREEADDNYRALLTLERPEFSLEGADEELLGQPIAREELQIDSRNRLKLFGKNEHAKIREQRVRLMGFLSGIGKLSLRTEEQHQRLLQWIRTNGIASPVRISRELLAHRTFPIEPADDQGRIHLPDILVRNWQYGFGKHEPVTIYRLDHMCTRVVTQIREKLLDSGTIQDARVADMIRGTKQRKSKE